MRLLVFFSVLTFAAFQIGGCSALPMAIPAVNTPTPIEQHAPSASLVGPGITTTITAFTPTLEPTLEASSEAQVRVTVEVTPVDPETLDEASRSQLASDYYLVVASVIEDASADLRADQKRIVLTVNIGSESGVVRIAAESLALVGIEGDVYPPIPEHPLTPYLVGAEVRPRMSFYGFVAFDTPADLEADTLVWCIEDSYPCDNPVMATLP